MKALFEQYRPRSLDEIVGQDKAVSEARKVLARCWGGCAWWITGASGTGKTSIAYAIAREGADDFFITEIDAGQLTPAAVRELELEMRYTALATKTGRAYIVNEAHGLRRDTIRLLLVLLERLPGHVCVMFTTTKQGEERLFDMDDAGDAAPLISRCVELRLESGSDTTNAFAQRAKQIAEAEGIDGLPDGVYARSIAACKGNFRAFMQRLETGRFREDAKEFLERELLTLRASTGQYADWRRAEITELIERLEGGT